MDTSIRAALRSWAESNEQPLVLHLGFRPNGAAAGPVATIGHAGSTVAVLLRVAGPEALATARRVRSGDVAHQHLFLVRSDDASRLEIIAFGLDGEARRIVIDLRRLRAADIDTLEEMRGQGEDGLALAVRHTRALDRAHVTRRFFDAFRAMRARIAGAWHGIPANHHRDRERLALLFLCRLMFLYFLQRDGRLAGRPDYFAWLRRRHARTRTRRSFYRHWLIPLFFGALNRRPERRTAAARRLGRLPYLNGGLFERDALERRYRTLDLPADVTSAVFDELLERYRFTTHEHATTLDGNGAEAAVDPEMLGRVFEGLMDADERGRTGTFYTPAPLVDEVVRHALAARVADRCGVTQGQAVAWLLEPQTAPHAVEDALAGLRALDPACGSGAFLLGLLTRIAQVRRARGVDADVTGIVGDALHGVDLQNDAALLCALRLWLTLAASAGRTIPPLPNLDRRIRQGDALLDPLDLHAARDADARALVLDAGFRDAISTLSQTSRAYLAAEPDAKRRLAGRIAREERALAEKWIEAQLQRLADVARELTAAVSASDLFGERVGAGHPLRRQLRRVREQQRQLRALRTRLRQRRGTPFFSCLVHFADVMPRGFDVVVSNPPWVRSHRWPAATSRLVRERYATCATAGWRYGTECVGVGSGVAAQVDMAVLFLELGLRLLAPGGVLAMLLPAKLIRSLFAAGARRLLLEQADLVRIEDRSLDTQSGFDADAFVVTIVARKRTTAPQPERDVEAVLHRAGAAPMACLTKASELPVIAGDRAAPWLLAPPAVRQLMRRMQAAGAPLGRHTGVSVHRGIMTGANEVMVLREVMPRLGDLSEVRAAGAHSTADAFTAVIESDCIRPLVRGTDIRAWQCTPSRHVIWLYDEHLRLRPPPRHLGRYLERHRDRLGSRAPNAAPGCLFRLSAGLLDSLVLWRDLAPRLDAVALPRDAPHRPVPLNSVYFVALGRDDDAARILAAYLNSLPVRVFTRTIAERAKDGFFRFFAWTVAVMPLPARWRDAHAAELCALSRHAHEEGRAANDVAARIDALVAQQYGIATAELDVLRAFDHWLSGGTS